MDEGNSTQSQPQGEVSTGSPTGSPADGAPAQQPTPSALPAPPHEDSGGHDPNSPIGPGNPPRATQFKEGNAGRPPGIRDSRQVAQKLLAIARKIPITEQARFAEVMGEVKGEFSQRELMVASQVLKAISRSDTAAYIAVLRTAGELTGEDDLPPPTVGKVTYEVVFIKPGDPNAGDGSVIMVPDNK